MPTSILAGSFSSAPQICGLVEGSTCFFRIIFYSPLLHVEDNRGIRLKTTAACVPRAIASRLLVLAVGEDMVVLD